MHRYACRLRSRRYRKSKSELGRTRRLTEKACCETHASDTSMGIRRRRWFAIFFSSRFFFVIPVHLRCFGRPACSMQIEAPKEPPPPLPSPKVNQVIEIRWTKIGGKTRSPTVTRPRRLFQTGLGNEIIGFR